MYSKHLIGCPGFLCSVVLRGSLFWKFLNVSHTIHLFKRKNLRCLTTANNSCFLINNLESWKYSLRGCLLLPFDWFHFTGKPVAGKGGFFPRDHWLLLFLPGELWYWVLQVCWLSRWYIAWMNGVWMIIWHIVTGEEWGEDDRCNWPSLFVVKCVIKCPILNFNSFHSSYLDTFFPFCRHSFIGMIAMGLMEMGSQTSEDPHTPFIKHSGVEFVHRSWQLNVINTKSFAPVPKV